MQQTLSPGHLREAWTVYPWSLSRRAAEIHRRMSGLSASERQQCSRDHDIGSHRRASIVGVPLGRMRSTSRCAIGCIAVGKTGMVLMIPRGAVEAMSVRQVDARTPLKRDVKAWRAVESTRQLARVRNTKLRSAPGKTIVKLINYCPNQN